MVPQILTILNPKITHSTIIEVRYSETDSMSYTHHSNYLKFYEIGRLSWFKNIGFSYKKLEEEGVGMPVIDLETKYILPIKYDEEITIKTSIKEIPSSRIIFFYEIYNQDNVLSNTAKTTLTFINLSNKRPVRTPKELLEIIKDKF